MTRTLSARETPETPEPPVVPWDQPPMNIRSGWGGVHVIGEDNRTLCGRAFANEPTHIGRRLMWGYPSDRPVTCKHCLARKRALA